MPVSRGGADTVNKPDADTVTLKGQNVRLIPCRPKGVPTVTMNWAREPSISLQSLAFEGPTVALHTTDECIDAVTKLVPMTVIVLVT